MGNSHIHTFIKRLTELPGQLMSHNCCFCFSCHRQLTQHNETCVNSCSVNVLVPSASLKTFRNTFPCRAREGVELKASSLMFHSLARPRLWSWSWLIAVITSPLTMKKKEEKRVKSEGMSTRLTLSPFPCVVMQSAYSRDKRRGPVSAALSAEDLVTQRRRTVKYYRGRQFL